MKLVAKDLGKKFINQRIFKGLNLTLLLNDHLAIIGSNGSGKSTLLKCLMGYSLASEGKVVVYDTAGKEFIDFHDFIAVATPYSGLIEELTIEEQIVFQADFKSFKKGLSTSDILDSMTLNEHRSKQIKMLSSGMKQRVKLVLAILSNASFVFLDEPTSNLDSNGVDWFKSLVETNKEDRTFVVCSNHQETETWFCTQQINMLDLS